MSNVKVGDRVVRAHGYAWEGQVVAVDSLYVYVKRDDGVEGSGQDKSWCVSHGAVEAGYYVVLSGATPNVASWDYAEADRLREAARAACESYNRYIESKPDTYYPRVYFPADL